MASSDSIVGMTPSTTNTTTAIIATTTDVGDFASTALWMAVAFCLLALGLTVTNLYVMWRKKKVMTGAQEGKENLIAEQS